MRVCVCVCAYVAVWCIGWSSVPEAILNTNRGEKQAHTHSFDLDAFRFCLFVLLSPILDRINILQCSYERIGSSGPARAFFFRRPAVGARDGDGEAVKLRSIWPLRTRCHPNQPQQPHSQDGADRGDNAVVADWD